MLLINVDPDYFLHKQAPGLASWGAVDPIGLVIEVKIVTLTARRFGR
jgi:hypothetical protein